MCTFTKNKHWHRNFCIFHTKNYNESYKDELKTCNGSHLCYNFHNKQLKAKSNASLSVTSARLKLTLISSRRGKFLRHPRKGWDHKVNKKAVLSQRWPRDPRYISRSWAVAELWPFEIIQDGGGRHLEFIWIENSAIRSAVPENPTL